MSSGDLVLLEYAKDDAARWIFGCFYGKIKCAYQRLVRFRRTADSGRGRRRISSFADVGISSGK